MNEWFFLGHKPLPPLEPAPREFNGQMCGIRVPDLPEIPALELPDPSLFLTWCVPFYGQVSCPLHVTAVAQYLEQGYVDFLLDWAAARSVGYDVSDFVALCLWLKSKGCRPVPMLCSKDFDPHHDPEGVLANIQPLLAPMITSRAVQRVGIGFELDAWMTNDEIQQVIDPIAARLNPAGLRCYAHFLPGHPSPPDCGDTANFWLANVGKLAGLFAQSRPELDIALTCDWFNDCLERAAGHDNYPAVLIDGHGVDIIGLEITASRQAAGMTEAEGDRFARAVLAVPPRSGPAGIARVMGSGNGR